LDFHRVTGTRTNRLLMSIKSNQTFYVYTKQVNNKVPYSCVFHRRIKLFHFQKGEARLGTDESTFNSIISTRSWAHLRQVNVQYIAMYGHSLEKAITSEFSANAEKILLGIRKSRVDIYLNLTIT